MDETAVVSPGENPVAVVYDHVMEGDRLIAQRKVAHRKASGPRTVPMARARQGPRSCRAVGGRKTLIAVTLRGAFFLTALPVAKTLKRPWVGHAVYRSVALGFAGLLAAVVAAHPSAPFGHRALTVLFRGALTTGAGALRWAVPAACREGKDECEREEASSG